MSGEISRKRNKRQALFREIIVKYFSGIYGNSKCPVPELVLNASQFPASIEGDFVGTVKEAHEQRLKNPLEAIVHGSRIDE